MWNATVCHFTYLQLNIVTLTYRVQAWGVHANMSAPWSDSTETFQCLPQCGYTQWFLDEEQK